VKVTEAQHRLLREIVESAYSKAIWRGSCTTCSKWPCLSREVGPDYLQRSLPTSAILWFGDSVNQKSTIMVRDSQEIRVVMTSAKTKYFTQ